MKKASFLLILFIGLLVSCSKEEIQTESTNSVESEMLNNNIIKQNPSLLNSSKYLKINALNEITKKTGIFYYEKKQSTTYKVSEKRGLWYSGGDCAIYTDDVSGVSIFVPADSATQFLMNVCGLSNLA